MNNHSKYHNSNAFCGNAGPEEMKHLRFLVDDLSDDELRYIVDNVGIHFRKDDILEREQYEGVIDEADREKFYKEYRNIIKSRK